MSFWWAIVSGSTFIAFWTFIFAKQMAEAIALRICAACLFVGSLSFIGGLLHLALWRAEE